MWVASPGSKRGPCKESHLIQKYRSLSTTRFLPSTTLPPWTIFRERGKSPRSEVLTRFSNSHASGHVFQQTLRYHNNKLLKSKYAPWWPSFSSSLNHFQRKLIYH
ncbi:hypothetical protein DPMN_069901 [Dreissena polymorpha]|uniref:Uncharacterized protein n=1 Tax=Dreissena polymorpha TaxID=45954 RepID=A0A9D4BUR3_DREPO|nr:hypothetical protein DPMN_069901 [Dreissena polymorpha]